MRVMGFICLHVVSRELSDKPVCPGMCSVYNTYFCNAQIKNPSVRMGKISRVVTITKANLYNISPCRVFVNVSYPP